MEDKNYYNNNNSTTIMKLIKWLPNMVENIATTIATPFTTAPPKPAAARGGGTAVEQAVRRVAQGVVGALYVGTVLSLLMVAAVVLGVLLVNYLVEEPLFVRKSLFFDYTRVNPEASVVVGGGGGRGHGSGGVAVPVGHRFRVSLELLVPDSDYNRDVGLFQVVAEVISTKGKIIAMSSQPTMLHFQSHPIRLMRTLTMGIPLVLGLADETQKITINILNYKETTLARTGAIKITLMPRAGTLYLPQLYEAELVMRSKLPRVKELIYNWKWTFYVWTSSYIYILLLLLLVYFFKPILIYPISSRVFVPRGALEGRQGEDKSESNLGEEREFDGSSLRKWQQYQKKRKAELVSMSTTKDDTNDGSTTSASSYTVMKDDVVPDLEEDVGDSESICD